MRFTAVSIYALFFAYILNMAAAHGSITDPAPRGLQAPSQWKGTRDVRFQDAVKDNRHYFPAGDKGIKPGAALASQKRQKGTWTPFTPMANGYRWSAGVCGDMVRDKPGAHLSGGPYFYDGTPTRIYRQGQAIPITYALIAHHNGFIVIHVCDVGRCGGDISPACFKNRGACHRLKIAPNKLCNKTSKHCGPIDMKYKSRFYLPCMGFGRVIGKEKGSDIHQFGGKFFNVQLPKGLKCKHCVLHFTYTAANKCNPPGYSNYFSGDHKPGWGSCPGQAGALGGVSRYLKECGGGRFAEEYYNCADIRIVGAGQPRRTKDETQGISIKHVEFRAKNMPGTKIKIQRNGRKTIYVKGGGPVDFVAVPRRPIKGTVSFQLAFLKAGVIVRWFGMSKSSKRPFNIGGTSNKYRMKYWGGAKYGKPMVLRVKTRDAQFHFQVTLVRT